MKRYLVVMSLIGVATLARAEDPKVVVPQFAGTWRLVPGESEDAHAKMREAMDRRPDGPGGFPGGLPGGGPRGGGFPGGGHRGGGPFGPRDGDDARPDGSLMREFVDAPPQITITQSDSEIALQNTEGDTLVLYPDDKKRKSDEGSVETRTRWKGAVLVSESSMRDVKLTTSYALTSEGRLEVRCRFRPPFGSDVKVKRIYELKNQTPPAETSAEEPQ